MCYNAFILINDAHRYLYFLSSHFCLILEDYFGPCQASMMKHAKIINLLNASVALI